MKVNNLDAPVSVELTYENYGVGLKPDCVIDMGICAIIDTKKEEAKEFIDTMKELTKEPQA